MLRQEIPEDYKAVEQLTYDSFKSSELYANGLEPTEHKLVAKLRKSEGFVPELSIVVQEGWDIVGHIMSTIVKLDNGKEVLALAPMSVLPILQKSGVGLQLIMETLEVAKKLGYGAIIVLGHSTYYPKFGFDKADKFSLSSNIDGVENYLFAQELIPGYLAGGGKIIYPEIFFE